MLRLFTLEKLSDSSSDAVYKICLSLEQFGLTQAEVVSFESYDELYFEAVRALEDKEYIIVAAENEHYNDFKRNLMNRILLEEASSEEIEQTIRINAGEDINEIDLTGHCLAPRGCLCHLSSDGLYSGFTCDALLGKVTCLSLDFMRIDTVLEGVKRDVLNPMQAELKGEPAPVKLPRVDFQPQIAQLVKELVKSERTLALSTGEAAMWVYSYYDKVADFNTALRFVEVVDDRTQPGAEAEEESVRIIRHAREAMLNSESDLGAAVSEIYSSLNENGQTVYFAYAAVVDKSAAKVKKINTTNSEDLGAILPHTLNVLLELAGAKLRALDEAPTEIIAAEPEEKAPEGKISKKMLIFGAIIIAVAIISPIIMVALFFNSGGSANGEDTTNPPVVIAGDVTTADNVSTTGNDLMITSNNAQINVTQPSAGDIYVSTTQPVIASTSGTFTFDVFGHGHGVGMSQEGADWLARSQGWSWTQILGHYYYCENAKIVTGDAAPETISYAGTPYKTRDFLASVLEAEMGSSFHPEALKAQFVAIYTFAKYYGFELKEDACAILGSSRTPSTEVYAVVDEMLQILPYIMFGDRCALTPFHAFSAGKTTSYYNVWGRGIGVDLPYLNGARLSYGDTLEEDYRTSYTISSEDFKALAKSTMNIDLSGDPANWISIISHDGAINNELGYVSTIRVGDTTISGNDFRIKLMSGRIRSHCFYLTYTPNTQTIS